MTGPSFVSRSVALRSTCYGTQNALFHFKNPPLMDEAIDCAWKRSAGREGPTGDMTYFEVGLREEKRETF